MRLICIAAVAFMVLPFTAFAAPVVEPSVESGVEPTVIVGSYRYEGQYTHLDHEHFEFVYAKTDAERRRLETLRAEGYTCFAKYDDNWICRKIVAAEPADPVVAAKVARRFGGMRVRFSPVVGMDMVVDTDTYKVWRALQKVSIATADQPESRLFTSVQYAWTPGGTKVYPGGNEDNPAHDMFTPLNGAVGVLWDFTSQPNHSQMDTYSVFVTLPQGE